MRQYQQNRDLCNGRDGNAHPIGESGAISLRHALEATTVRICQLTLSDASQHARAEPDGGPETQGIRTSPAPGVLHPANREHRV